MWVREKELGIMVDLGIEECYICNLSFKRLNIYSWGILKNYFYKKFVGGLLVDI